MAEPSVNQNQPSSNPPPPGPPDLGPVKIIPGSGNRYVFAVLVDDKPLVNDANISFGLDSKIDIDLAVKNVYDEFFLDIPGRGPVPIISWTRDLKGNNNRVTFRLKNNPLLQGALSYGDLVNIKLTSKNHKDYSGEIDYRLEFIGKQTETDDEKKAKSAQAAAEAAQGGGAAGGFGNAFNDVLGSAIGGPVKAFAQGLAGAAAAPVVAAGAATAAGTAAKAAQGTGDDYDNEVETTVGGGGGTISSTTQASSVGTQTISRGATVTSQTAGTVSTGGTVEQTIRTGGQVSGGGTATVRSTVSGGVSGGGTVTQNRTVNISGTNEVSGRVSGEAKVSGTVSSQTSGTVSGGGTAQSTRTVSAGGTVGASGTVSAAGRAQAPSTAQAPAPAGGAASGTTQAGPSATATSNTQTSAKTQTGGTVSSANPQSFARTPAQPTSTAPQRQPQTVQTAAPVSQGSTNPSAISGALPKQQEKPAAEKKAAVPNTGQIPGFKIADTNQYGGLPIASGGTNLDSAGNAKPPAALESFLQNKEALGKRMDLAAGGLGARLPRGKEDNSRAAAPASNIRPDAGAAGVGQPAGENLTAPENEAEAGPETGQPSPNQAGPLPLPRPGELGPQPGQPAGALGAPESQSPLPSPNSQDQKQPGEQQQGQPEQTQEAPGGFGREVSTPGNQAKAATTTAVNQVAAQVASPFLDSAVVWIWGTALPSFTLSIFVGAIVGDIIFFAKAQLLSLRVKLHLIAMNIIAIIIIFLLIIVGVSLVKGLCANWISRGVTTYMTGYQGVCTVLNNYSANSAIPAAATSATPTPIPTTTGALAPRGP